jgi:CheY-like chemotaxis protein
MNYKKILLVDDDPDDQFIFTDAVDEMAMDIECVTASNGFEALHYLESAVQIPSLIFLDLNMPVMDGFDCLKLIKRNSRFKKIPVIIFTTSDNPSDKKRVEKLGADFFFTKTPDFKLLKEKLREIFETNFSKLKKASRKF